MSGSFVSNGRTYYLKALREKESEELAPYAARLKKSRDHAQRKWIKKRMRVIKRKYQRFVVESGVCRF